MPGKKLIRKLLETVAPTSLRRVDEWRSRRRDDKDWGLRIADAINCPDNDRLPRAPGAGKIENGCQVMHNGLKVLVDGYYGPGITRMLAANLGCHEPQEEVIFDVILKSLKPGAVIIEAGCYWAFYSMWFMKAVEGGAAFLLEPVAENLAVGQRNFAINEIAGDFTQAYVGAVPGPQSDGPMTVSIDWFANKKGLDRVAILHADVQGWEFEMLKGAETSLNSRKIDYLFVSTHSPELHENCVQFLKARHYTILVSINLEESYSIDGIIVACSPEIVAPPFRHPSKKNYQNAS